MFDISGDVCLSVNITFNLEVLRIERVGSSTFPKKKERMFDML